MDKNVNELTIGEAKAEMSYVRDRYNELSELFNGNKLIEKDDQVSDSLYEVGKNYILFTVTRAIVGRLKKVTDKELLFEKASWVADSGRWHDSLKNGLLDSGQSEIEPYVSDVIIGRYSIVDCTEYLHDLPEIQK